jgi:hypothetical protein
MSDESESERLAARLIEAAGSKREAQRLIRDSNMMGSKKKGRPGGTLTYRWVDQRLIINAVDLELLWNERGCAPPPRIELINRQVEACWRGKGYDCNGERRGRWDEYTCAFLGLGTREKNARPVDTAALEAVLSEAQAGHLSDPKELTRRLAKIGVGNLVYDLGTNPKAVMARIADRPGLDVRRHHGRIEWWFDKPGESGPDSFWRDPYFGISLAPESWRMLHLDFPRLGFLPP